MKTLKLNVLLGKTDHLASQFGGMLKDYIKFFKGSQGAFVGEKRTYVPKDETVDDPSKRKNILVQTTVDEKWDWLKENTKEYIDSLFSVEATNASGTAKAKLVVDGEEWGEFTTLELLRLKSLLEHNDLKGMLKEVPVRSDSEEWTSTKAEMYEGRKIMETPLARRTEKTTEKEEYILKDPNINAENAKGYVPQVSQRTITKDLGEVTHQRFSGEISQREKAEMLKRRANLVTAVTEALKIGNDVEVVESELSSDKIFNYLFEGK